MRIRRLLPAVVGGVWLLSGAGAVVGQGENFGLTYFVLEPPGARSLAMGSAFLGLADDATAAEVNPAGLVHLSLPEVSLHYRATDLQFFGTAPYWSKESVEGESSTNGVSFASFVKPFEWGAISLYGAKNASVDGYAATVHGGPPDYPLGLYRSEVTQQLDLDAIGVSAAYRFGDYVSLGVTLRLTTLELSQEQFFSDVGHNLGYAVEWKALLDVDDDDFTYVIGLIVNPDGKVSLGLVYEEGGEYSGTSGYLARDLECLFGCPGGEPDFEGESFPEVFSVPDVLGLGLAWKVSDRLVLLLDAKEITYSDLNILGERVLTNPDRDDPDNDQSGYNFPHVEPLDDEVEINFGAEYVFPVGENFMAARVGVVSDPDHDGFTDRDTDETYLTLGAGFAFGSSWQIDVGASFGDKIEEQIVSAIFRF